MTIVHAAEQLTRDAFGKGLAMSEELRSEMEGMVEAIADEKARAHVAKAVKHIGDASRRLIVANGIAQARQVGHDELALKLATAAYEQSPHDPYFLLEYCCSLGNPEKVVDEIRKFSERVDLASLPQDEREKVLLTLAEGYKEMGNNAESIRVLEEMNSEMTGAVELLAEQYYQTGEPQKVIDILDTRIKYVGRLTQTMAQWLAKSFEATGDYKEAFDMLAQFQDDPAVKPIFERARKELGYVVEEGPGRLAFEHPQPEDQRQSAEDDLSRLLRSMDQDAS
ncbi:MAG: tetratricopeptide repeat protein [Chloroflexota bacterium]